MDNKSHRGNNSKEPGKSATPAKKMLWTELLQEKKFHGYEFDRRFRIDQYIVDFICQNLHWIIEVNDSEHKMEQKKAKERDRIFTQKGYELIHFSEKQVLDNLRNVEQVLEINYLNQ